MKAMKAMKDPRLGTKQRLRAGGTRNYNVLLIPDVVEAIRKSRHNVGYGELIRQLLAEEYDRLIAKAEK